MKCLAVNTANALLSVALLEGEVVRGLFSTTETRDQGNILLSHIQNMLADNGWSFHDLDVLGVVTGPGSFTGIRIGLAAMRGLALAAEKPLIGISSFELFAAGDNVANIIAIESWREELYLQALDAQGHTIVEAVNETPEHFVRRLDGLSSNAIRITGDAAEKMRELFPSAVIDAHHPEADHVARLVIKKYQSLNGASIEPPVPFYLRDADVTLPKKP